MRHSASMSQYIYSARSDKNNIFGGVLLNKDQI